uniref:O-methyltransferase n=1 Tax=Pyricularia oryzae (strain P131) TaxID=1143193 RepID=L7J323_PYRO1
MKELWDWTVQNFASADKMSSPLQGATFKFIADWVQPKRVLEIGCFTGFSAMAWYEATVGTRADITTLELDANMIRASRRTIDHFGLGDRVRLLEGPAAESIETLTDQFDLVFVDANKDGYEGYVKQILDRGLLSTRGLILCDNGENVFARGMTIVPESNPELQGSQRTYWTENGKALDGFCKFCKADPRIDVILLPVYDGLTLIKLKSS